MAKITEYREIPLEDLTKTHGQDHRVSRDPP